jgi:hypothetical protein
VYRVYVASVDVPFLAPQVNAGLLTSGVMALYMVFLCYSAIMRSANAPSSGLILKACRMYLSNSACMVIFRELSSLDNARICQLQTVPLRALIPSSKGKPKNGPHCFIGSRVL